MLKAVYTEDTMGGDFSLQTPPEQASQNQLDSFTPTAAIKAQSQTRIETTRSKPRLDQAQVFQL